MTEVLASPLAGRRERLWPAVLASLAAHAALVAFALLHRPPPIVDLGQKPIVARLVRLGEQRPESWLPRKDAAPPAPPAPAAPAPGAPPRTAPARPAERSPSPRRPDALASALDRIRRERAREPAWGSPEGDALGEASEASEGDRYLALVTRALQSSYRLPATLSDRDRASLEATVVLTIEPDGQISSYRFERRSGNAAFDDALERAIRRTRLPPPPDDLRERYRSVGLGVRFHV